MRIAVLLATGLVLLLPAAAQTPNQANNPGARLVFAGIDHAPGGTGPITVSFTGPGIPMEVTGNSGSPFVLAVSAGASVAPGFPTPFGTLHTPLVGLTLLMDGFGMSISPLDVLANTGVTGTAPFTLPSCNPLFGTVHSWQALVADATAPGGLLLTASSDVTASCGINMPVPLADDDAVEVVHSTFCPFTDFYNSTYTSIFVGSNGFITLGAGDTSYLNSQANFDSGSPRIAPAWTDLDPSTGGISYIEGYGGWTVVFSNVPEYGPVGANSFAASYNQVTGAITLDYTVPGGITLTFATVGITPGGGLASPITVFPSLRTTVCGGTLAVPTTPLGTMESLSADYLSGFDLAGCMLTFQPASFGGPASAVANSYVIL